jgi:hypothetical protein
VKHSAEVLGQTFPSKFGELIAPADIHQFASIHPKAVYAHS